MRLSHCSLSTARVQVETGHGEQRCCDTHACSVTAVVSDSLRPHGLQSARLLCPWGFSRQEYWSGWPCPPPRDLPDPGIEPTSLTSPALAGGFLTTRTTWGCDGGRP
ncbi:unnamed protein product [Rangifer tarandus platyrhynchus]|uniref:Uncharacterized protein n=1 Tax=Rangifer tarandus platyrhynchus TaxID=3082113 RepID=A0AC59YFG5_RANTA